LVSTQVHHTEAPSAVDSTTRLVDAVMIRVPAKCATPHLGGWRRHTHATASYGTVPARTVHPHPGRGIPAPPEQTGL